MKLFCIQSHKIKTSASKWTAAHMGELTHNSSQTETVKKFHESIFRFFLLPQLPVPIVEWRVGRHVMELMEGNDTISVAPWNH